VENVEEIIASIANISVMVQLLILMPKGAPIAGLVQQFG